MSVCSNPIFLVGLPRSGTKLLRSLLDGHTNISMLNVETDFLPYWVHLANELGDLSDYKNFQAFYSEIETCQYFFYSTQMRQMIQCKDWYDACETFSVADIFDKFVKIETNANEAQVWGDKTPKYIKCIPLITELYPGARIVHITRDVRDVSVSSNNAWGKSMLRTAAVWNDDIVKAHTIGKQLQDQYYTLQYERILESPKQELEKLCTFLDLDFEESMLTVDASTENLGDTQGATNVVATNKKKYKSRMSAKTLLRIEEAAKEGMDIFGYKADNQNLSFRPMTAYEKLTHSFRDKVKMIWKHIKTQGPLRGAQAIIKLYISDKKIREL